MKIPKENFDRLMAAVTILTTDQFFRNLPAFVQLCDILSGGEFNPKTATVADTLECAWGITEAAMLSPPTAEPAFSDEIRHYVGGVLDDEGYLFTPKILSSVAIRDESEEAVYGYSDDPDMFASIHKNKQAEADEVDGLVQSMMKDLVEGLEALPLEHGDAKGLLKRLDLRK
jgi:hypothetical protein